VSFIGDITLRERDFTVIEIVVVLAIVVQAVFVLPRRADFPSFYYAAKLITLGRAPEIYNESALISLAHDDEVKPYPYIYNPFFALLVVPLTAFGYRTAYWLYFLLQIILLWAFMRILRREFFDNNPLQFLFVLFAFTFSGSSVKSLVYGQSNIVVAFLWLLSLHLMRKNRLTSMLALSVSTLIKLTPAVSVIALIATRKWRSLRYFILFLAILVLFSLLVVGLDTWSAFLSAAPFFTRRFVSETGFRRIFELLKLPEVLVSYGWIVVPLALMLASFPRIKSLKHGWAYSGWLIPMFSPLVWAHHFLPTFVPFLFFGQKIRNRSLLVAFNIFSFLAVVRSPFYKLSFLRILFLASAVIIALMSKEN